MSRPPRLAPPNYVGVKQHFLTICTEKRYPFFLEAAVVSLVCEQILRAATEQQFEITAYCFMPDHLHALVTGREERSDLCRFVGLAKQRSGFTFGRTNPRRLWQEGYYDRILRSDESLFDVVRYVVTNPLRAGLVERLVDYPFWGSAVYAREEIVDFISRERR